MNRRLLITLVAYLPGLGAGVAGLAGVAGAGEVDGLGFGSFEGPGMVDSVAEASGAKAACWLCPR